MTDHRSCSIVTALHDLDVQHVVQAICWPSPVTILGFRALFCIYSYELIDNCTPRQKKGFWPCYSCARSELRKRFLLDHVAEV